MVREAKAAAVLLSRSQLPVHLLRSVPAPRRLRVNDVIRNYVMDLGWGIFC